MSQVDLDQMPPRRRLALVRDQVLHLTQAALAQKISDAGCHVKAATIANIETGRRNPGLHLALALSKVTGIPPEAWVAKAEEESHAA